MRTVVVVALDDVIAFDLATAVEVLGRVRTDDGSPGYRVLVAGPRRRVSAGPMALQVFHGLEVLAGADLVVVPGRNDPTAAVPPAVLAALVAAHGSGATLASICVGAFDLAATGLLDGRRATTHWQAAELFAQRYPRVHLDPRVLFVDEGALLTSAGAAAGLDLCLHLVERHFGAAVAAAAARTTVVPLSRDGGQAQFIEQGTPSGGPSMGPTLAWIEQHAGEPLTVQQIADHAHVSVRTLSRRFHQEVGRSPGAHLTAVRLRRAKELLEVGDEPITAVARRSGFGSAANLRAHFGDALLVEPRRYRASFRSRDASEQPPVRRVPRGA